MGVRTVSASLLAAKLLDGFPMQKKAFNSPGHILSKYTAKVYVHVTDDVTSQNKSSIRFFDCHHLLR